MKRFLSIGECMIEMSSGIGGYQLGYAGDTLNTAWYAKACLTPDWQVDYHSALGDDLYSDRITEFLRSNGIGIAHIRRLPGRRPGLYLIHQQDGDRQFTYWRGQSAAKQLADNPSDLAISLRDVAVAYFSGISLAILAPEARVALLDALSAARRSGSLVAFDPNYRPSLWSSADEASDWISRGASNANVLLPTFSDDATLFGDPSPVATADRYLGLGAKMVAVKNGGDPALIASGDARDWVPAQTDARLVDATGAGDSFNGAFLAALAMQKSPNDAAASGHKVASIVVSRHGALVPLADLHSFTH